MRFDRAMKLYPSGVSRWSKRPCEIFGYSKNAGSYSGAVTHEAHYNSGHSSAPYDPHPLSNQNRCYNSNSEKDGFKIDRLAVHRQRERHDYKRLEQHNLSDLSNTGHFQCRVENEKREVLAHEAHVPKAHP